MIDPFALLQLPSTFTLSTDALDMAWMRASATAHPDAGGSVNHAAQLNEARELLANPEQRANLRLNMLGGPNADQDQRLPDGFLMEMLELRERIDAEIEEQEVLLRAKKQGDRWNAPVSHEGEIGYWKSAKATDDDPRAEN